jgi:hypothetical protein
LATSHDRPAQVRPVRRVGGGLDRRHRDPVRLDVVGVAVAAVLVVGHQHLRAHLADDGHGVRHGLVEVRVPERPRVFVGGRAHHPRVAVTPRATEEPDVADT